PAVSAWVEPSAHLLGNHPERTVTHSAVPAFLRQRERCRRPSHVEENRTVKKKVLWAVGALALGASVIVGSTLWAQGGGAAPSAPPPAAPQVKVAFLTPPALPT